MGLFKKIAENICVGSNATFSMLGDLESFDEKTGKGYILWARKKFLINANPNGKYGIFEAFPYGIPMIGSSVLFNTDATKTYAIQVVSADKNLRHTNILQILKEELG